MQPAFDSAGSAISPPSASVSGLIIDHHHQLRLCLSALPVGASASLSDHIASLDLIRFRVMETIEEQHDFSIL